LIKLLGEKKKGKKKKKKRENKSILSMGYYGKRNNSKAKGL